MKKLMNRWWPSGLMVLGAVAILIAWNGVASIVIAAMLIVYAWVIGPAFFPESAELKVALERAAAGTAPLVFWKPGCTYCIAMRIGVGSKGRQVSWLDSSINAEAREVVRSKNGGNHTTPTVVFRDETRTNPGVGWVRQLLG